MDDNILARILEWADKIERIDSPVYVAIEMRAFVDEYMSGNTDGRNC